MLPHAKFCAKCAPQMCVSRTHLPNCKIHLQPNYTLIEIEKFRKNKPQAKIKEFELNIKHDGEYLARLLPSNGLDMIYNHKNGAMLSDQMDFNFHDHGFEITERIHFNHLKPVRKVECPLAQNSKFFIGDVNSLTDKSGKNIYTCVAGDFFNPVYMCDQLIGYSINQSLSGHDAVSGKLYSDEGYYDEMILRYTDKATKTVDGILLAGLQNENYYNFQEGVDKTLQFCADCRLLNNLKINK